MNSASIRSNSLWGQLRRGGLSMLICSTICCALLSSCVASAQGVNAAALKELSLVLEFEEAGSPYGAVSLDLPGERLLIAKRHDPRVLIIDVESAAEEIVQIDNRLLSAWTDPETGAVYMVKLGRELPLDVKSVNLDLEKDKIELHYFPSLDNFRRGVPKWVNSNFTMSFRDVRYISSFRVFVCTEKSSRASDRVIILNESGSRINTFDLPGDMVAVDRRGDSLELFVRRQVRLRGAVKTGELCSILVRSDFGKIGRVNPMYPIQGRPHITPIGLPFYMGNLRSAMGTRFYRFRGLQEGEVSKFFHDVFPSPGYWSYEDLQPVRKRLDQHLAPLTLDMVIEWSRKLAGGQPVGFSRLFNLNQLEAFEDRDAFEVVWNIPLGPANGNVRNSMLNRAGDGFILPAGTFIGDAVINEDRNIFVAYTHVPIAYGKQGYKLVVKVLSLE